MPGQPVLPVLVRPSPVRPVRPGRLQQRELAQPERQQQRFLGRWLQVPQVPQMLPGPLRLRVQPRMNLAARLLHQRSAEVRGELPVHLHWNSPRPVPHSPGELVCWLPAPFQPVMSSPVQRPVWLPARKLAQPPTPAALRQPERSRQQDFLQEAMARRRQLVAGPGAAIQLPVLGWQQSARTQRWPRQQQVFRQGLVRREQVSRRAVRERARQLAQPSWAPQRLRQRWLPRKRTARTGARARLRPRGAGPAGWIAQVQSWQLGLACFKRGNQLRNDLEDIADHTEVGDLEDRRIGVLVDGNDGLGSLHACLMLDSS